MQYTEILEFLEVVSDPTYNRDKFKEFVDRRFFNSEGDLTEKGLVYIEALESIPEPTPVYQIVGWTIDKKSIPRTVEYDGSKKAEVKEPKKYNARELHYRKIRLQRFQEMMKHPNIKLILGNDLPNLSEVAEWLNRNKIPTLNSEIGRWTPKVVRTMLETVQEEFGYQILSRPAGDYRLGQKVYVNLNHLDGVKDGIE